MQISRSIFKRIILSIVAFVIGVAIYWLFSNGLLYKNNSICTIIRNYLPDGLWIISFFFIAIIFSKDITQKYVLLTSVFVLYVGIIFEIMQLTNFAKGTFDLIDILVYLIAVLIACLIEINFMEEKMKKLRSILLLLLCGGLFFTFALGSSSNASSSSDSEGTEGKTNDELATYKINEDFYITNNNGKYRVKFTSVKETSDRNQFSETQADRVIILEWEYENLTMEDDLLVSEVTNFKLYDKQNNKLETYPAGDTKYGGNVGKGRKTVSSEAFALNSQDNYVELEFYDNVWNGKPDCKVILEW